MTLWAAAAENYICHHDAFDVARSVQSDLVWGWTNDDFFAAAQKMQDICHIWQLRPQCCGKWMCIVHIWTVFVRPINPVRSFGLFYLSRLLSSFSCTHYRRRRVASLNATQIWTMGTIQFITMSGAELPNVYFCFLNIYFKLYLFLRQSLCLSLSREPCARIRNIVVVWAISDWTEKEREIVTFASAGNSAKTSPFLREQRNEPFLSGELNCYLCSCCFLQKL